MASAMTEKPLYVRVAEALGCAPEFSRDYNEWSCACVDHVHAVPSCDCVSGPAWPLARYDTDWSSTGQLIERYKIDIGHYAGEPSPVYAGAYYGPNYIKSGGADELVAACNLILALHASGKLPR